MDYKKTAEDILAAAGGAQNIVSAAHCATRLRLVVANDADASKEKIEDVPGVRACFRLRARCRLYSEPVRSTKYTTNSKK